jgi:dCTP deaminase
MVLPYQTLMELGPSLLDPFEPGNVQPASIDLRLGTSFRVPDSHTYAHIDLDDVPPSTTTPVDVALGAPFVLHPGEFVLGSTVERIHVPNDLAMYLDGKSSLGRIGLAAHVTAGYFDPGFQGIATLELVNLYPVAIVLRPGKLICQSRWMRLEDPTERPYRGRYQGDSGAGGSRYGQ